MTIDEIANFLKSTEFTHIADSITYIKQNGEKLKNIYKIGNADSGYFVIKIRNQNYRYISDSLENLNLMVDESNLFFRYKQVFKHGDYLILISNFVFGQLLHPDHRSELPRLFSELAKFNKSNIISGPFTSMYADGNYFETTEELIEWELNYHFSFWVEEELNTIIRQYIQPLKMGLSCLISEDLNLGNMKLLPDNRIVFIDTEWLQRGLNLYQFDHINYFQLDEPEWYSISTEAKLCYSAYFKEIEISLENANKQIKAFEILSVLRRNTYWRFFKMENKYGQEKLRLETVLDTAEFI